MLAIWDNAGGYHPGEGTWKFGGPRGSLSACRMGRIHIEPKDVRLDADERAGPDTPAGARARRIIAAWNATARREQPAEFFPTVATALKAGCWRLSYACPACQQMATVDVRDHADAHHPRAAISMLIPKLSCARCCPNPPLAVLMELDCHDIEIW